MTTPVEMRIPFELSSDGSIAIETNPDKQIGQRVRALIGTTPGERLMQVDLGITLVGRLFEPDDTAIEGELMSEVANLLAAIEPGVHVLSVHPIASEHEYGVASLEVNYVRTESPSSPARLAQSVNTALIKVGGSVSEVIRG